MVAPRHAGLRRGSGRRSRRPSRGRPRGPGWSPNASLMPAEGFLGDLLGRPAPSTRPEAAPAGQVLTNSRTQPNGVEDLRAAIGLIGRDAHLGRDLEDALADRLDVAVDGVRVGATSGCRWSVCAWRAASRTEVPERSPRRCSRRARRSLRRPCCWRPVPTMMPTDVRSCFLRIRRRWTPAEVASRAERRCGAG